MELCKANYLNTTTMITLDSNTVTAGNLFDYKPKNQYISSGYNDDLTTTSVVVTFGSTISVSRISLMETNIKAFDIFYDGTTANTFALTSTAATTTSQWSNNSESSMFLNLNTIQCSSITFDFKSTQLAGSEKAIGMIYIGDIQLNFERIPSSKNYKIKLIPKEVLHTLSNGAKRRQFVDEKWNATIKYKYISSAFRNNLKTTYDLNTTLVFVPFGTSTSWDGILFPCVWPGAFEFYQYSDNAVNAGYSGSIKLWETD